MVRVSPGGAGSAASVVSVVGSPTTAPSTGSAPVAGATGTGRGAAAADVERPNRGMVVLAGDVLRVVVAPAVVTDRVAVVGDAVPAVPAGGAVTAPDEAAVVPVCGAAVGCAVVVCAGVAVSGGGGAVVVGAAVVGAAVVGAAVVGAAVVGGGGGVVVEGVVVGGVVVGGVVVGGVVVGPPLWPAT